MKVKGKGLLILIIFLFLLTIFFLLFKFISHPSSLAKKNLLPPELKDHLNIIIITIDTLRADHLECYGYKGVKTPHINGLAAQGILFEQVISPVPLTLPAHCSIFTGTYPLYHGVRDNGSFYLNPDQLTLAEILKEKGYKTAAFIGAFVLDSRWGLDQGFDYYYDNFDLTKYKKISLDAVQRRGDEVLREACRWLETTGREKFMVWIHLYDPHTPYDPPEPYRSLYQGRPYGLYDGEIAYVDQLIGSFLNFLRKQNLLEKTLIVLTSDHGESLGEHKESAHGFFIYEAVIRVPLIIRLPGENSFRGKIIKTQVSSLDIMPTILDLIAVANPGSIQGKSLWPLLLGREKNDRPIYSETFYPRYHYGWSELQGVRQNNFKFIAAPRPELYDLSHDPGEKNNLFDQKKSLSRKMQKELNQLIKHFSSQKAEAARIQNIDQDSLLKLQTLGYIGSFHHLTRERPGPKRADPKDRIVLYNEIKLTQFLISEEKFEAAERKIRTILDQDPSVLEARYLLGYLLAKQKRYEEAIKEFQRALEVDPEYYEAIFGLAMAYKESNQLEAAIHGFKRLLDLDPKDTKPYIHLADIYQDMGKNELALEMIKAAVEIDPESRFLRNRLGAIYLALGKLDEAEREIRQALSQERSQPLLNAHFNLALLHEARGEMELAIEAYRKEQQTCPYNWRPDFNLGLLFFRRKDLVAAEKEFRSCLEKNDQYAPAYLFLAKIIMDKGENLIEAERLALKAFNLKPDLPTQIFGHFLLADIYHRLHQPEKANLHLQKARHLEALKSGAQAPSDSSKNRLNN